MQQQQQVSQNAKINEFVHSFIIIIILLNLKNTHYYFPCFALPMP